MSLFGSRISTFFGGTSGGGGGGSFNPTTNYLPFNNAGLSWGDSFWVMSSDYVATSQSAGGGSLYGFIHNTTLSIQKIGDFGNIINGVWMEIDNTTEKIYSYHNGVIKGIELDFANDNLSFGAYNSGRSNLRCDTFNHVTYIGDTGNIGNFTAFGVDDVNQYLIGSSNLVAGKGNSSDDRIKINVGGVDYLIVLETP